MIADPVFADILTGDHQDNQSYDDAESNGRPSHSHSSASQKNGAEPHSRDIRPHSHDSHSHGPSHGSHSHDAHSHSAGSRSKRNQAEKDLAQEKVCSTLRSFVRDWADEGANERKACYDPCLEALERYFTDDSSGQDVDEPVLVNGVVRQKRSRGEIKVLVPGCGLGRLAMEIAARGEYFHQSSSILAKNVRHKLKTALNCCRCYRLLLPRQRILHVHAPRLSFHPQPNYRSTRPFFLSSPPFILQPTIHAPQPSPMYSDPRCLS